MRVRSLDWTDTLEEGMATHSSVLAWRIHGQRSQVGYSPWGRKVSDTTATECAHTWGHRGLEGAARDTV